MGVPRCHIYTCIVQLKKNGRGSAEMSHLHLNCKINKTGEERGGKGQRAWGCGEC